jgi:hypothetical protein
MRDISALGESLLRYIEPHFPQFIQDLNPGISDFVLQSSVLGSGKVLPHDFYELYEWRNGSLDGFPKPFNSGYILDFTPIELVYEDMKWELYGNVPPSYKKFQLLPFIRIDSDAVAIALGSNYSEEAHVICITETCDIILYCDSITSMLTSTTECFESGSITINHEGVVSEDYHSCSEIWQKNNPLTVNEMVSNLELLINRCILDQLRIEDNSYHKALESLTSTLATLWRFRPPEAITLIQENLVALKRNSLARGSGVHLTLDKWLKDVF